MTYKALEPNTLSSLGVETPTFTAEASNSLLPTTTFLFTLCFMIIVAAAFWRLVQVGGLRLQASEDTLRRSNDIFKKVVYGLAGSFALFILLATLNSQFVTGNVSLTELRTQFKGGVSAGTGSGAEAGTNAESGSGGSSRTCDDPSSVLSKVKSGNVCGNTSCTALSGCNYQQYLSVIERETAGDNQLRKMVIVTMCKESKANPNATNKNSNGTYDCGLMQINQTAPCTQNPGTSAQEDNIKQGIALMKQKISAVTRYPVVPGVPNVGNVFASYNCCANGTIPAAASADCTTERGYPSGFPKWGCPLNPGDGAFNMCSVKNYACDLTACLDKL